MENKKRGAYFVAVEKKDLTIKHSSGINVSSSATAIPRVSLAFCPERGKVVMVGYDESKPSIYVDEWGDRYKNMNLREVTEAIDPTGQKIVIKQMQGRYVRPTEKNLLDYLRIIPQNKNVREGEHKDEQPRNITASFYELNFEKKAKERTGSDKEKTQAKALVYESDYATKKAFCVAKKINIKTPDGAPLSDAELEDILAFRAERDPKMFKKEYNTPTIWNSYYIRSAIERGYLSEKDGGRVLVDNGGSVIKSAQIGKSAIEALAEGAATNNASDAHTLDTIKEFIDGKKRVIPKVEEPTGDVVDKALALGVIENVDGLFLFEGDNLGSSRTALKGKFEQDSEKLNKLTKLVELQASED